MFSNMLTSSTLCVSHAVPIWSGNTLGRTSALKGHRDTPEPAPTVIRER
jgi:hypothetical protein